MRGGIGSMQPTSVNRLDDIRAASTHVGKVGRSDPALTRAPLRPPKAAAIAGLIFAIILTTILSILRVSIAADVAEPGAWLIDRARVVHLAMGLVPFAGIALLWFIGVLRDRLGEREDRF